MHFLRSSFLVLLFSLFHLGCTTSRYKVIVSETSADEIHATPDRFLPHCEQIDTLPNRYGFMVHFLDDIKTVATAAGMMTDKKTCQKWENEIRKILNGGKAIVLKGAGNMNAPRETEKFFFTFPKHGTFQGNGRSLQFFKMINENGGCFTMYHNDCP